MKESWGIGGILIAGIVSSFLTKSYAGIAIAAIGIPLYLAYTAREQNVLAKSRLYDRDLFVMIGIAIVVILAFDYLWDPRMGLIAMAIVIPLLAIYADRLKARKKAQNT